VKDPTSANLDRIQIIKGWTQNSQSFEKIYDVAWSGDRQPNKWTHRVPAIQSTVDIEKATYTNSVAGSARRAANTQFIVASQLRVNPIARLLCLRVGAHVAIPVVRQLGSRPVGDAVIITPHQQGRPRGRAHRCRVKPIVGNYFFGGPARTQMRKQQCKVEERAGNTSL
jgi:hypothetical protein